MKIFIRSMIVVAVFVAWIVARNADAGPIRDRLFGTSASACGPAGCATVSVQAPAVVQVPVAAPQAAGCAGVAVTRTKIVNRTHHIFPIRKRAAGCGG